MHYNRTVFIQLDTILPAVSVLYDYNYSPVQDELQKRTISIHFSSHPSTVAMKWYKQLQSQKYLNK